LPINSILDLAEAGVHFGHRVSRWNPKMKPFIRSKRKVIHVIDLKRTCTGLVRAVYFLENVAAEGGKILFVGTKRPARAVIEEVAKKCEMPYVTERWLGGSLTNHMTIRSRLARLEEIESMERTGEIERYSKKMISSIMREKRKLVRNLDGIRTLNRLPRTLVIVDPRQEAIAVKEARKLNIPVVALIDTDSDPDLIDIPIPGNDDAMRSILIIMKELEQAVEKGIKRFIASGGVAIDEEPKAPAAEEGAPFQRRRPRRGGGGRGGRGGPGGRGGQRGRGGPRDRGGIPAPREAAETTKAKPAGEQPAKEAVKAAEQKPAPQQPAKEAVKAAEQKPAPPQPAKETAKVAEQKPAPPPPPAKETVKTAEKKPAPPQPEPKAGQEPAAPRPEPKPEPVAETQQADTDKPAPEEST